MGKKAVWISQETFEMLEEVADEEELDLTDLVEAVLREYAEEYLEDVENCDSDDE